MLPIIILGSFLGRSLVWAHTPAPVDHATPVCHCVAPPIGGCQSSETKPISDRLGPDQASLLVFISFNLPHDTLKQLAQTAKQNPIPTQLVLRGLYQDSFLQTAERLKQLDSPVQIHPELFERYHVQAVPTFVVIRSQKETIRLRGNVPLSFALEQARQFDAS